MSRANAETLPAELQRYTTPPFRKEGRGFLLRLRRRFTIAAARL
jgi:hypothetical protein